MIGSLYSNQKAVIPINGVLSEAVQIRNGVRQGCILSPSLFIAYSEIMINETIRDGRNGINIGGNTIKAIEFADNQAIV